MGVSLRTLGYGGAEAAMIALALLLHSSLLPVFVPLSEAATLAGVSLPDVATVGGQAIPLNGLGLREKYFLDIYIGGLYLTHPTRDGAAAIVADEPKRLVMHYLYSRVTRAQLIDGFEESFGQYSDVAAQRANIQAFQAAVPAEILAGEEMAFDYVPGVGTTMLVRGTPVATVPGTAFMKLVFGIYVGPHPPTADLKRGLLGG